MKKKPLTKQDLYLGNVVFRKEEHSWGGDIGLIVELDFSFETFKVKWVLSGSHWHFFNKKFFYCV